MLVLKLMPQTSVYLTMPDGRLVRVVMLRQTNDGGVRLGFDAPRDVNIARAKLMSRDLIHGLPPITEDDE